MDPAEADHGPPTGETTTAEHPGRVERPLRVLVYCTDPGRRQAVVLALGRRAAPDLPPLTYVEATTAEQVLAACDRGHVDLVVLDGEAAPTGGMGLSRQLHDELGDPPPILLLIGRRDDAWLATWSRADAVVAHPLDALLLADAVSRLLRRPAAPVR